MRSVGTTSMTEKFLPDENPLTIHLPIRSLSILLALSAFQYALEGACEHTEPICCLAQQPVRSLSSDHLRSGECTGQRPTVYHRGASPRAHYGSCTIVGLAQNFAGSNNVNWLHPGGQSRTRMRGGNDAASARCISSRLTNYARALFPVLDDPSSTYLVEKSKSIEPEWCCPVIPIALVDGSPLCCSTTFVTSSTTFDRCCAVMVLPT